MGNEVVPKLPAEKYLQLISSLCLTDIFQLQVVNHGLWQPFPRVLLRGDLVSCEGLFLQKFPVLDAPVVVSKVSRCIVCYLVWLYLLYGKWNSCEDMFLIIGCIPPYLFDLLMVVVVVIPWCFLLFTGQGASGVMQTSCGLLEGIDLPGNDIGDVVSTDSPKECCELCVRTDGKISHFLEILWMNQVFHYNWCKQNWFVSHGGYPYNIKVWYICRMQVLVSKEDWWFMLLEEQGSAHTGILCWMRQWNSTWQR